MTKTLDLKSERWELKDSQIFNLLVMQIVHLTATIQSDRPIVGRVSPFGAERYALA
ncbi:hypothetical protein [Chamaesiphon minutus]|uniref:hypothetical protein n=1 Tax=Chamaesiphon minutus TaxID=1173032 RepID=UPI0002F272D5|nr:hypothetical protein [Chamaesiphon minutus]